MADSIFRLHEVVCSYNGTQPVLEIPELEIPSGKLIAIVGKSGAGKSTILETLGLMNQTVASGTIEFQPGEDQNIILNELWSDPDMLAEVRNRYFSFIFQDTNLMPNFTAIENACIPQLLQGTTLTEAEQNVALAMDQVGLTGLDEHVKVYELSGGQRQRLAFVRAITPNFLILFGDEPTGNLDKHNSFELLKIIRHYIHDHQRTSIIVSHDLNLSIEFADQIIVLTKEGNVGTILPTNVFFSKEEKGMKDWYNNDQKISVADLRDLLHDQIQ